MPLFVFLLNHIVAAYEVSFGHVRVDLRSMDVGVTEHALHYLDRNAATEADGGGEGVPGAVGGEVLPEVHFLAEQ